MLSAIEESEKKGCSDWQRGINPELLAGLIIEYIQELDSRTRLLENVSQRSAERLTPLLRPSNQQKQNEVLAIDASQR